MKSGSYKYAANLHSIAFSQLHGIFIEITPQHGCYPVN